MWFPSTTTQIMPLPKHTTHLTSLQFVPLPSPHNHSHRHPIPHPIQPTTPPTCALSHTPDQCSSHLTPGGRHQVAYSPHTTKTNEPFVLTSVWEGTVLYIGQGTLYQGRGIVTAAEVIILLMGFVGRTRITVKLCHHFLARLYSTYVPFANCWDIIPVLVCACGLLNTWVESSWV